MTLHSFCSFLPPCALSPQQTKTKCAQPGSEGREQKLLEGAFLAFCQSLSSKRASEWWGLGRGGRASGQAVEGFRGALCLLQSPEQQSTVQRTPMS